MRSSSRCNGTKAGSANRWRNRFSNSSRDSLTGGIPFRTSTCGILGVPPTTDGEPWSDVSTHAVRPGFPEAGRMRHDVGCDDTAFELAPARHFQRQGLAAEPSPLVKKAFI